MRYARILTVTTPATFAGLVSLATVKDELDITTTALDTRLNRWIGEATSAIESYIGRTLRLESVTERLRATTIPYEAHGEHFYPRTSGSYGAFNGIEVAPAGLVMRRYPVGTVASIVEDATTTLVQDTDFEVDPDYGLIYRLDGTTRLPWTAQGIAITYTGGYASTDAVPGDLQAACLTLLKHKRAGQTRDPSLRQINVPGVIEQQFWVGGAKDQANFPPDVLSAIERYRDVSL